MLEKLKGVSTILVIPTIVLYFFGFICVNAYLARFGIVSFDAINVRFIIAGLYPLISLTVVIFLGIRMHSHLPVDKLWETNTWKQRALYHVQFLLILSTAAFVLSLLMNLGSNASPSDEASLRFSPLLGNYDYVGEKIAALHFLSNVPPGFDVLIKSNIYIFAYLLLVTLFILLCVICFKWIEPFFQSKSKTALISDDSKARSANSEVQSSADDKEYFEKWYRFFPILILDLFFIAIYLSLAYYSGRKLSIELFDFRSFTHPEKVTQGLVLAWLFPSILTVYMFLTSMQIPADQLRLKFAESMSHFGNIQWAAQQLVIPILASLFLFGTTIFPKIPFAIGGGEPRLIQLEMIDPTDNFANDRLYLIGENSQFLFVIVNSSEAKDNRALEINKNLIRVISTRTGSTTYPLLKS